MRLSILAMAALATQARAINISSTRHQNQKRDADSLRVTVSPTATAASGTTPASSTTTPTHTVAVGATGFNFTPNNLTVPVGSVVEFNFYPGNHSVARSAFKFPCIPFEDTGANRVGFFSGFQDTNVYSSDGPKYRILVNDSEPIFYYCSAPSSCIEKGMIGVINPNATWTLEVQQEYTANTTIQLSPGDPLPSEGTSSSSSSSSSTSKATATGSGSGSGSASSSAGGHHIGTIVGIVVGIVAAVLAALAFAGWCCVRRNPYFQRRLRERRQRTRAQSQRLHRTQNDDDGHDGLNGSSNPLSPMSPSTRQSTPGSATSMFPKYNTPPPPPPPPPVSHRSLQPAMADMAEYFSQPDYRHRTPPVPPGAAGPPMPQAAPISYPLSSASMPSSYPQHIPYHLPYHHHHQPQQPQHAQHYYPGLPIYSTMTHTSPLRSHPFYDKDYHSLPAPVELPTAVAVTANVAVPARSLSSPRGQSREYASNYTVHSGLHEPAAAAAESSSSPAPKDSPTLRESPVIGAAARTSWDKNGDNPELTRI